MDTVVLNGASLAYEERGIGEPVVLIHLVPYADCFAPLMDQPSLSEYRLIRYHRRGYGGSSRAEGPFSIVDQATEVTRLLDYLGVGRAHIAGHSIGALIALQFAADHPDMVGSLTLTGRPVRQRQRDRERRAGVSDRA